MLAGQTTLHWMHNKNIVMYNLFVFRAQNISYHMMRAETKKERSRRNKVLQSTSSSVIPADEQVMTKKQRWKTYTSLVVCAELPVIRPRNTTAAEKMLESIAQRKITRGLLILLTQLHHYSTEPKQSTPYRSGNLCEVQWRSALTGFGRTTYERQSGRNDLRWLWNDFSRSNSLIKDYGFRSQVE